MMHCVIGTIAGLLVAAPTPTIGFKGEQTISPHPNINAGRPQHHTHELFFKDQLNTVDMDYLGNFDPTTNPRIVQNEYSNAIPSYDGKKYEKNEVFHIGTSEHFIHDNSNQNLAGFRSGEVGFEDIRMVLKKKKGKPGRVILDGSIRGVAKPGRILAIMGPSGSGKSSLLHAISGKVKEDRKISLYGKRYIDRSALTGDSQIPSAFVEQDVNFFSQMTVKETLDFQVKLKMGKTKTNSEREELVKHLMDQMGLTKSAHTIVGDSKVRGLSGGEQKRLSIACEMITSPSIIIADEPTSGLDSFQSAQVIESLRRLADQGATVIVVIHQPSQNTFQMFDDLLLVSEGKLMYFGEVSKVRRYFAQLGYGCPSEVGTAEHVLSCISPVVGADAESERLSAERIEYIAKAAVMCTKNLAVSDGARGSKNMKRIQDRQACTHTSANTLCQFKLLLGRSLQENLRSKTTICIMVAQQVMISLIYGGIYKFGTNQASIMDRFGLLSLITVGGANMAMASTIRTFPKEKAVVTGEMASQLYRAGPYFIAKAISELPLVGAFNAIFCFLLYPLANLQKGRFLRFLCLTSLHTAASEAFGLLVGSMSPTSDVAMAVFPPILVLNMIFDGRNISEQNTPYLLRWVNKIGLIRWGFTGLALNEFDGLEFNTSGPHRGPVAKTGAEALARFGLEGKSVGNVIAAQVKIILGCWLLSYIGLTLTRPKYEVMKNPQ